VWDLRSLALGEAPLIATQKVHSVKHNEGVLAVIVHPSLPLIMSGGGDSLIKVLEVS